MPVNVLTRYACTLFLTLLLTVSGSGPVLAGSIWTGANSALWNDAGNWNGGVPVNGDTLYFDLAQSTANLNTSNDMVGLTNLSFDIDKSGVTISGNAISIGAAGITADSLGSPTLNIDLNQPGDTTYTVGSSRSITLNGVVSGAGGLIKTGGGTLYLNGGNTYSGGTTVSAGTLRGSSASLLGDIANNATVRFDQGIDGTYAGVMSGTGSLTKSGAGTLTLSGANTYTGGTTVSDGTLQGSATSLQGGITNNSAVVFDQAVNGTYAGVMSGTGSLTKTGSEKLILSGANTYTGGTTVSAGTLQGTTTSLLGNIVNNGTVIFAGTGTGTYTGAISGTGAVFHNSGATTFTGAHTYSGGTRVNGGYLTGTTTSLQGDFVVNGHLTFDQAFDGTFSGNVSGTASAVPLSGGLTKSGTGTVILTGTNTYNGGTRIQGGTLQGNTTSLQGNFDVSFGAAVTFDQGVDGTYAGNVTGWGKFNKTGAGTLTLSGTNTYTGGTTVSAGALQGNTTSLQGTITNNAAVVFDQGTDGTYAGIMSGTGSLTKTGAGNLTLSGANTYSGGTTVNAGKLTGTTTSLRRTIVNNADVIFDQAGNGTYAGVMSGTGSLSKNGTGTVTLTGANTYSGGTLINGGALAVSADNNIGAAAGGLTFNGGALRFDSGFTSSRAVTLQAGGGTFDTNGNDGALTGIISGAGGLTKSGAGTLTLSGANTYSGGTMVSAGTLQGNATSLQGTITNNAAVVFDQGTDGAYAGIMSGTGSLTKTGAGNLTLSGANTYNGGTTVNAGKLTGTTTSLRRAIVNNAEVAFDQGTDGTYAGIMSGTGSLNKTGAGNLTLTGANTYSGGTTVNGGSLTGSTASLQGNITNNAAVAFDQSASGTYAGVMSGTGSLSKTGTGTVTLTGTNTYSGGTLINGGTLAVSADNNMGAAAGGLTFNGGTLQFNTSFTTSRNVTLQAGGGTFNTGVSGWNSITLDGVISGTGGLTKTWNGTVTLTGANTYSGGTTVNGGELNGTTTSLQGYIINNSVVEFSQDTDGTYAGVMIGTGSLNKTGAGTVTLSGANTYSGGTGVSGGTLQGNTTSLQGRIVNAAAVVFDQGADGTYAGVMEGTGSLTKIGAGTLTLSGVNTYSGGTTVSAGTLQGITTSLQGNIANNAAVVFDQGADGTYAGAMSGTGRLTKTGLGTLTLSGANTYSGGTAVNAGTLQGTTSSLQGSIANNAAVVFDQGTDGTYAGGMSGTGRLTKSGAGVVVLTGANTYSGGTSINGGTLAVGATANLGAAAGRLTLNGGTLRFDGGFISSRAVTLQAGGGTFDTSGNVSKLTGILSGAGGLTKAGAGTLTLTGANTYAGGTAVNGGTLAVGADNHLGAGAGGLSFNGGTLRFDGGFTTSRTMALNAGGGIIDTNGNNSTLAGVLSGTGSFTKTGSGTLTLSGANSYSGGTTVTAGTLQGNSASLQGGITNNAAVVFDQAAGGTYAGVMSGTGSLSKSGAGTLTLSGANTYSGGTTVSAGTLQGSTASLQGSIANNASVVFDQVADGTYAGIMSGTGSLTKNGTGTVALTGASTYSGGTAVNAGTLAVGADTNIGAAAGGLSFNGGTLRFDGAFTSARNATINAGGGTFDTNGSDNTLSGILFGIGGLTKSGAGTLILTGGNTYSGGTTVSAGVLQGTTVSVRGNITNNAAVVFDQAGAGTYAGVMSGTGSLTKRGAGTVTLTGSNTYTGGTTVSAGVLQGTAISLQGNITNNAAVVFDQAAGGTYAGVMSGTGSLTKSGAGTLTLSGANTYTGGTTVSAGTLQGSTASLQGSIANNASVVFDQAADGTYAGIMSGTGNLTKSGTGALILSGVNTYSGGSTVNAGTLQGSTNSLQGDITNNAAVVFDQAAAGTYSGVISGTGSIAKTGTGTLMLTGANTTSGSTAVNAGTLAVNGSLAGPVTVGAAGTLGGNGTVGSVTVSGSLAPGNSIGTINTGSLTFNAGSVYTVEVDAAGNSDRTNVTGTVSLGGATLSVLAQSGNYGVQTDYLVISNDGVDAVTGTFGTISSNLAFLDPTVAYAGGDGNDVVLRLARNDVTYSAVATTPNESAVAGALEQMVAGGGGDAQVILNALTGLSAPQACRAYNEMSGAGNAAFFDTGIAGMTQYMKTMTERMGGLRADAGMGAPSYAQGPIYLAAADTGSIGDADPALFALGNASPLTPDKNWGIWGRGTGMWGDSSGDDIASKYNYAMGGFTLGMDSRISDRFIVGVSAGYAHTRLDFDELADTGKTGSYQAALYGDYSSGPWYADAILSYAGNGYETTRSITVGAVTRTAAGDFDGREAAAYFEGGYALVRHGFQIRPLASVQLTHIVLDGYTETGAGALNLSVDRRSVDSYIGAIGVRVARPVKTGTGLLVSPEGRLRWAHEFSNDDRAINAGFAGVPGASFVVTGDKPDKDSAILGMGFNVLYREDFNFYFNYDVNVSRDHTDHALAGGLRYMWD